MDFQEFKKKYQKIEPEEVANSTASETTVSVCVQTYQHANFIKDCLDGILMQETDFPIEVLLGEDASTDGTREICKEYAQKYPDKIRLFLHHRENNIKINGQPTGRFNFLYNMFSARGKYIAFCEGDDYWTDPLKLKKQVVFLEKNDIFSLCFHNVNIYKSKNGKDFFFPMHESLKKGIFDTLDILRPWLIPTASILFRRNPGFIFPEWFFNCPSGDRALFLFLSLDGKFKYINEIMGVYRKHDQGLSLTHYGYEKVFSMIYLYQSFDIFTNYQFHLEVQEAMKKELNLHLPEFHELRRLRRNKKVKLIEVLERTAKKIKGYL